jgi:hypothetical protein
MEGKIANTMTKNAKCGDEGKILFSHPNLTWNKEKVMMSNLCPLLLALLFVLILVLCCR